MNQSEKDLLLVSVRRDIAANEAKATDLRARLEIVMRELTELRRMEAYLTGELVNTASPETVKSVNVMEIAKNAERILRDAGPDKPLRVMSIAKAIIGGYKPEVDARHFEHRVYSVLKRRPSMFVNAGRRGFWTLAEFKRPKSMITSDQSSAEPS